MKISRSDYTDSEILYEFAEILKKRSVQSYDEVKEKNEAEQDQLKNILHGYKPKYPSVAAAVEDLKKRTGLNAYLKQIASKINNTKIASEEPEVFSIDSNIKSSINSLIERRRGNIDIIAVISECVEKNKINSNLIDDNLKKYIAEKILEVKKRNPSEEFDDNLYVKEDTSLENKDLTNDDMFANMTGKI
jgi:hypothetical protein